MALDSHVAGLLAQLAANPDAKGLADVPPEAGRGMFHAMAAMFDVKDAPIGKVENRKIPGPAGEIPVRIYTPVAAGTEPLPCLVYYHGGGWVIGDLETHEGACRMLANDSGCRVISVDYRLAPEHVFPAAPEDCFAALKWVAANAQPLGVDPKRIAVGGDSAGGNLSAVVCQMAREAGGPSVAFQLLIYPATDMALGTGSKKENATGYFLEERTMHYFYDLYVPKGTDENDPRLSPLRAKNFAGLPPAYVITAQYDVLRDEGRLYAEKLKEAGVKVTHVNYDTLIHGFFTMAGVIPAARPAIADAAKAVKAALG
ncbi:MAG: alpha/beta hydrolase [Pseudomonadota bacterium]|jgi:acetyl esterase